MNTTEPAIFYVNCVRMRITLGNSTAQRMFETPEHPLADRPVSQALPLDKATSDTLHQAIRHHRLCTLPPALLELPDSEPMVVQIHVSPWSDGLVALQIYAANASALDVLPDEIPGKDTMAVLGLDQFTPEQGATPDQQLIGTYRTLRELVRPKDVLSLPLGQALIIRLRETNHKEAQKICESMLSHLNALQSQEALPRYCMGIAKNAPLNSPLQSVVEAYHALWQARLSGVAITTYNQQHKQKNLYNCLHHNSLYNSRTRTAVQQQFLRSLCQLDFHSEDEYAVYRAIASLCCEHPAVNAAALYRGKRNPTQELATVACKGEASTLNLAGLVRLGNGELQTENAFDSCYACQIPVTFDYSAFLLIQTGAEPKGGGEAFKPGDHAIQFLSASLAELPVWRKARSKGGKATKLGKPLDTGIVGYISDAMEGAVDQAIFLAGLDVPIAIVGPRGTGKMYVARTIGQTWGGEDNKLITLDCRELRNRRDADAAIHKALCQGENKTLVFKSPHLMNVDSQRRLAKQLSSRVLHNSNPPQYLPRAKYIALFPDDLCHLSQAGTLTEHLASVFAGYPIHVPPIKDRKQAVLRWGHKILAQECAQRGREVKGFTADAEAAMLQHDWPGNISEMRQRIGAALDNAEKSWVTPVDLGIYKRVDEQQPSATPATQGFLEISQMDTEDEDYQPSALEHLDTVLGEAVNHVVSLDLTLPLGTWLEDEIIVSACDRYRGENSRAARFLQTRSRNIGRWMEGISERENERLASTVWQEPRRKVQEWIRETAQPEKPPLDIARALLLLHLETQGGHLKTPVKATIMGVSAPTYLKRLSQHEMS